MPVQKSLETYWMHHVIAWLEFELSYHDIADKNVNDDSVENPHHQILDILGIYLTLMEVF